MRRRLEETVFSVAGRRYDWLDVVLWATAFGDWTEFVANVRLGLACVHEAEDGGDEAEADEDAVEAAANEFRYTAGLLSAEEMDEWLAASGLTADEWMASIERMVSRQGRSEEAEDILARFPVDDDEVESVLWCDGVCSGELGRFARALAGRASIYERLRREGQATDAVPDTGESPLPAMEELVAAIPGAPVDAIEERMAHLSRLESALRRFTAGVLTPRAIRDQISARYLDWIRFDSHVLSVADEQVAREAALSVRADGLDLGAVAPLAGTVVREERLYLDEAPPTVRDALVSAGRGDLVGPLLVGDEFQLVLVRDKVMPTEADPEVRRRAEGDLLARLLDREIAARVEWHHPIAESEG